MELNEFIANFAEQFDDTDASEIQANTDFHDIDDVFIEEGAEE